MHARSTSARAQGPGEPPRAWALIPARLGSTRLPRKMLLEVGGVPLCVLSAQNAAASGAFARVALAVDDGELRSAAERHGIEAVMTGAEHQSGTDRILEAYRRLAEGLAPAERPAVLVNVQGDEPELDPADLANLVRRLSDPGVQLATLFALLSEPGELARPEVVKLVASRDGRALYFSRAPIPARGHGAGPSPGAPGAPALEPGLFKRHIGVYAFRPESLERFCALPPSALERSERLEQLRWLEDGGAIHLVAASRPTRGIDTAEDFAAFVERQRPAHRAPPTHRP